MQEQKKEINEFAIASLVLGIISFISLAGIEKAIAAVIFGILAVKKMQREESSRGEKIAKAGIILGIFSAIITINILIRFYPQFSKMVQQMQNEENRVEGDKPPNDSYQTEGIPDTRQF